MIFSVRYAHGSSDAAAGELLLAELNCTSCHAPAPDASAALVGPKGAPDLSGVITDVRQQTIPRANQALDNAAGTAESCDLGRRHRRVDLAGLEHRVAEAEHAVAVDVERHGVLVTGAHATGHGATVGGRDLDRLQATLLERERTMGKCQLIKRPAPIWDAECLESGRRYSVSIAWRPAPLSPLDIFSKHVH